jgi:4-hydroxymandelate oxidase
MKTRVMGVDVSMPVLVAPTAFHKLAHPDGELATARAAKGAGTAMMLSSLSNTDVEDVVTTHADTFFQLYVYRDREATVGLVRRAEEAGCRALVLTVDAPLLGRRERDVRNAFALPAHLTVKNLVPAGYGNVNEASAESGLATYFASLIDPSVSWKDIAWLRSLTKLPLAIKGIVRVDDAKRARDEGVAAVVVSNHGGRQLDGSPATLDVLADIADAVGREVEVLMDGGVRRGTDVLKALALGAKAVLIGRPVLWGLACDGEAGVGLVLEMLRRELDLAMALAGCPSLDAVTRDLVGERH